MGARWQEGLRHALAHRGRPEAVAVWCCLVEIAVDAHGPDDGPARALAWMSGDLRAAGRAIDAAGPEPRARLERALATLPAPRGAPGRLLRRIREAVEVPPRMRHA